MYLLIPFKLKIMPFVFVCLFVFFYLVNISCLKGTFWLLWLYSLSLNIFFAIICVIFECRFENPLLKIFQLHVLSLEVLREAVYPFQSFCWLINKLSYLFFWLLKDKFEFWIKTLNVSHY